MKLRNKKTGEILELCCHRSGDYREKYNSLAELERDWEDYEEPKKYWHIAELCGGLQKKQDTDNGEDRFNKQIGNYFETEEEAEKAVEKLKAWKRLKEAGFEFKKWEHKPLFSYHYGTVKQTEGHKIYIEAWSNKLVAYMQDLDLLFSREEG